jgi:hypothetical protein
LNPGKSVKGSGAISDLVAVGGGKKPEKGEASLRFS